MYYRGKVIIVADNPAGTPAFEIDTGLLSDTTVNQVWAGCGSGSYPCGYPYPANHFLAVLTTGDIKIGPGGSRDILGTFFAANTALTAKFYTATGISDIVIQLAGVVSAQIFGFIGPPPPFPTIPQL